MRAEEVGEKYGYQHERIHQGFVTDIRDRRLVTVTSNIRGRRIVTVVFQIFNNRETNHRYKKSATVMGHQPRIWDSHGYLTITMDIQKIVMGRQPRIFENHG